jgi:phytoene dehydrogenase-like protein
MRRPFKGLKENPQKSYDVIVIGAGIGGLICANLLAREGLRVLLTEQHYMAGGYCSTFQRKGYVFDAATHFYPLLGNPTTMTGKLLIQLGIQTGWVKMDPVDQFHFPDGSNFAVPADFDRYLAKLKREFPSEASALDGFFEAVQKAYMAGLLFHFRGKDTDRLDPYRNVTVQQVLDKYFRSRKLKLLLTADCPHWGSPPSRTSFVFDSMLRLSYFLGNYYPVGGSQTFADELAQRFEENGGHIMMRTLVTRILVKNNTAYGVEIETGLPRARRIERVEAGCIVSNADLRQTLEGLLGPEHVEPDYLMSIRKLRTSYPCFLTHIGLKGIPKDALREAHGYYWDSWDTDLVGRNGLRFKIFVPTLYEPKMARRGGDVIIIQKVLDIDYDEIDDWAAHKADVERYIMNYLEEVIPGINEKIEVKMSASALTSYRYTLNYQGAMLGWEMSPDQLGNQRLDVVSPTNNLYFVGHWVQPGGGITPVIVSAMKVADIITG